MKVAKFLNHDVFGKISNIILAKEVLSDCIEILDNMDYKKEITKKVIHKMLMPIYNINLRSIFGSDEENRDLFMDPIKKVLNEKANNPKELLQISLNQIIYIEQELSDGKEKLIKENN